MLTLIKKEITHFLASLSNNFSLNLFFSNPANCITSIFPFAYNLNKQLVSVSTVTGIIYFNFSINLHDLHVQIFQAISFIFTALLSCCLMSTEARWPIRDGFLHCPGKKNPQKKSICTAIRLEVGRAGVCVCVCVWGGGGGGGGGEGGGSGMGLKGSLNTDFSLRSPLWYIPPTKYFHTVNTGIYPMPQ